MFGPRLRGASSWQAARAAAGRGPASGTHAVTSAVTSAVTTSAVTNSAVTSAVTNSAVTSAVRPGGDGPARGHHWHCQ